MAVAASCPRRRFRRRGARSGRRRGGGATGERRCPAGAGGGLRGRAAAREGREQDLADAARRGGATRRQARGRWRPRPVRGPPSAARECVERGCGPFAHPRAGRADGCSFGGRGWTRAALLRRVRQRQARNRGGRRSGSSPPCGGSQRLGVVGAGVPGLARASRTVRSMALELDEIAETQSERVSEEGRATAQTAGFERQVGFAVHGSPRLESRSGHRRRGERSDNSCWLPRSYRALRGPRQRLVWGSAPQRQTRAGGAGRYRGSCGKSRVRTGLIPRCGALSPEGSW